MKTSLALTGALCSILLAPPVLGASPRSVDPQGLDIAGVRTGMDYEQVVEALVSQFQAPRASIRPDPAPGVNIVTGTKLPSYLSVEKDGARVTVHFEGRVPADPARPLVAWRIQYEAPWSQQNAAQMAQAAVAKYGVQSNAPNDLPMHWCAHPSSNPGIGCPGDQARLELSQVNLMLTDPAWQAARIRFVQGRQAVRPNF